MKIFSLVYFGLRHLSSKITSRDKEEDTVDYSLTAIILSTLTTFSVPFTAEYYEGGGNPFRVHKITIFIIASILGIVVYLSVDKFKSNGFFKKLTEEYNLLDNWKDSQYYKKSKRFAIASILIPFFAWIPSMIIVYVIRVLF